MRHIQVIVKGRHRGNMSLTLCEPCVTDALARIRNCFEKIDPAIRKSVTHITDHLVHNNTVVNGSWVQGARLNPDLEYYVTVYLSNLKQWDIKVYRKVCSDAVFRNEPTLANLHMIFSYPITDKNLHDLYKMSWEELVGGEYERQRDEYLSIEEALYHRYYLDTCCRAMSIRLWEDKT